jgi:hypothetical protein
MKDASELHEFLTSMMAYNALTASADNESSIEANSAANSSTDSADDSSTVGNDEEKSGRFTVESRGQELLRHERGNRHHDKHKRNIRKDYKYGFKINGKMEQVTD